MPDDLAAALRDMLGRLAVGDGPAVDRPKLAELGWPELLRDDVAVATRVFFEEQGGLLLTSAALDTVALTALRSDTATVSSTAVGYPVPGRADCGAPAGRLDAVVFGPLPGRTIRIVLPVDADGRTTVMELDPERCSASRVGGVDPSLGLMRFRGSGGDLRPVAGLDDTAWDDALVAVRRAVAYELIGLARHMLGLAVAHVGSRTQFGRPIGTKQTVQHRLADVRVALDAAELLVEETWTSVGVLESMAAKALAGRAFRLAATHGQQVLGGIGFSWEHAWHRYLRRGLVMEVLCGGADLEEEIGSGLAAHGVPRIGGMQID